MSSLPTSLKTPSVTALPFIRAPDELCVSVRESITELSSHSKPSSAIWCATLSDISVKSALTLAVLSPVRISSLSAFAPSSSPMLSIIIDFPAPVSPERTVSPAPISISSDFITAIFSMCNDAIMPYSYFQLHSLSCCKEQPQLRHPSSPRLSCHHPQHSQGRIRAQAHQVPLQRDPRGLTLFL